VRAQTEIAGNGIKGDGKQFAREFLFLCKSSQKFVKPSSVKSISISYQNLIVQFKIKKIQAYTDQVCPDVKYKLCLEFKDQNRSQ
jgi:hypothetical protein